MTAELLGLDDLDDDRVVVSYSGGKDATAAALALKARGLDIQLVFADTGWEAPETYHYVREEAPKHFGHVTWVRSEVDLPEPLEGWAQEYEAALGHYSAMVRWCLYKGILPARHRKWCTELLKLKPFAGWYREHGDGRPVVVGIRREESKKRSQFPIWHDSKEYGGEVWAPILDYTVADVVAIHRNNSVPLSPLYTMGEKGCMAQRVGCWPCINARKEEIALLAKVDPLRVEILADLERVTSKLTCDRVRARGETPKYDHYGWFHQRADSKGLEIEVPISRAVNWALGDVDDTLSAFMDSRGGAACVRWGWCEPATEEDCFAS